MAQKERIKLEIDVLKALMLAFLTAIFGIFGYCVLNYSRIDWIQAIFIALGITASFIVLYALTKRIYKILKQIEELE
jgi:positive regulator of sigma E activity